MAILSHPLFSLVLRHLCSFSFSAAGHGSITSKICGANFDPENASAFSEP